MGACVTHIQEDESTLIQNQIIKDSLRDFYTPLKYEDKFQLFPEFGSIEKMTHQRISSFSLLKFVKTGSLKDMEEEMEGWKEKVEVFNHPNLFTVHKVFSSEVITTILMPITKYSIIFDHPETTLQNHPNFSENKPLIEQEVWDLLDGIVAALSELQSKKIYLGSLSMNDIVYVYTPFSKLVYKLIDRYFKQQANSSFHKIMTVRDSEDLKEIRKTEILAPVQITALRTKTKFPVQNIYKSDIFVLGMIALFCLDRQQTWKMYNWEKWTVQEEKIKDRITNLKTSRYMKQVLSNMLEIKEETRMDCLELDSFLSSIYEKMHKKRLLDIYPKNTFIYRSNNDIQEGSHGRQYSIPIVENHQNIESPDPLPFPDAAQKQLKQSRYPSQFVGKVTYSNGNFYEGQLNGEIREGLGILFDKEERKIVEGNWKHDLPSGDVIIYNPNIKSDGSGFEDLSRQDWIRYEGQAKQGQKHGLGNIYFSNGDKFTGEFIHDQANGAGIFVQKQGPTVQGEWRNNKFLE